MSQFPNEIAPLASNKPLSRKRPYKVVLEEQVQAKRIAAYADSYSKTPPKEYVFVESGKASELVDPCIELSRRRGFLIYNVSDPKKNRNGMNPKTISSHLNRVGHHFHISVVEAAVQEIHAGGAEGQAAAAIEKQLKKRSKENRGKGKSTFLDRPSNDEMLVLIKEAFPRMPHTDVKTVLKKAFKEGAPTVGNAKELTLARRIQLAVVAHVRHVYTAYDQHLKVMDWQECRLIVEQQCIDKIQEWRGEKAVAGEKELVFQETIILDSDDDDDGDNAANIAEVSPDSDDDYEPQEAKGDDDEEYSPELSRIVPTRPNEKMRTGSPTSVRTFPKPKRAPPQLALPTVAQPQPTAPGRFLPVPVSQGDWYASTAPPPPQFGAQSRPQSTLPLPPPYPFSFRADPHPFLHPQTRRRSERAAQVLPYDQVAPTFVPRHYQHAQIPSQLGPTGPQSVGGPLSPTVYESIESSQPTPIMSGVARYGNWP